MIKNANNHNGENWPYHQYEGSKPELVGSYVPCANNPCSEHGGSEVYATSPEDAYTKAHQNDTWGFTSAANSASTTASTVKPVVALHSNKSASMSETASTVSNDTKVNERLNEVKTKLSKKNNEFIKSLNDKLENDLPNMVNQIMDNLPPLSADELDTAAALDDNKSKNTASSSFLSDKAESVARSQGLYIDGSPLLHKVDENGKYVVPNDAAGWAGSIQVRKLAKDVFPGAAIDYDNQVNISNKSDEILNNATIDEINTIKTYTGDTFKAINNMLRKGPQANQTDEDIKQINSYIKNLHTVLRNKTTKNIVKKDTVVFRRRLCNASINDRGGEEKSFYQAVAKAMKNGSEPIVTRPDFLSTTSDVPELFDTRACSYIIKIPAGTRGLDISSKNVYHEDEFLIDKGYKFKVVGVYEFGKLDYETFDGNDETAWRKQSSDGKWYNATGAYPVIALELIPPTISKRTTKKTNTTKTKKTSNRTTSKRTSKTTTVSE